VGNGGKNTLDEFGGEHEWLVGGYSIVRTLRVRVVTSRVTRILSQQLSYIRLALRTRSVRTTL
jgi:hypothetical protein